MTHADYILMTCPPDRCLYLWTEGKDGRPVPLYAWNNEKTSQDFAGMSRAKLRRAIGWRRPRVRQHP